MPEITIITPVFNCEQYLEECIKSVLQQSFANFKYIIWDDGSSDNSLQIAQHYQAKDKRITLIEKPHQGLSKTLKQVLEIDESEYFGIVDADDLLHKKTLQLSFAEIRKHKRCGMIYTKYNLVNEKGSFIAPGTRCEIPYSKNKLLVSFHTFHFRLIRKFYYTLVGGYEESLESAEDYDLCLKLSEQSEIVHLPLYLYSYRLHPESHTAKQKLKNIEACQKVIEAAIKRRNINKKLKVEISAKFSLI